jgi:hypothetical protein
MTEPIFSRQEQAVVYLFSRYWHKIREFRNKQICDIQARFPDCSLEDREEAIEFEYGLGSFYSHVNRKDMKKLESEGYRVLYVVYWEQDTDAGELRDAISGNGFTGRVVFVCLHDHFHPSVEKGADRLDASWVFSPTRAGGPKEAYSLRAITEATAKLVNAGVVQELTVNNRLYRVAGYRMANAAFVECDHWKRIHFYTTSRFGEGSIPSRLFLKPTGCRRFSGCFEVTKAFLVNNGGRLVEDYYRRFYFYPYDQSSGELALVYSDFTELNYDRGIKLYDYLKGEGYALGQASELINDRRHMRRIDKIVG